MPPILGATADAHGTALAMVVPMCFFIAAWSYALCVNFLPAYRIPADKFSTAKVGIESTARDEEGGRLPSEEPEKEALEHKSSEI